MSKRTWVSPIWMRRSLSTTYSYSTLDCPYKSWLVPFNCKSSHILESVVHSEILTFCGMTLTSNYLSWQRNDPKNSLSCLALDIVVTSQDIGQNFLKPSHQIISEMFWNSQQQKKDVIQFIHLQLKQWPVHCPKMVSSGDWVWCLMWHRQGWRG